MIIIALYRREKDERSSHFTAAVGFPSFRILKSKPAGRIVQEGRRLCRKRLCPQQESAPNQFVKFHVERLSPLSRIPQRITGGLQQEGMLQGVDLPDVVQVMRYPVAEKHLR